MQLTLYHSVESTCAQKVRIVLAAKGLQWEEIRLNLRKGEQFAPEYLKLNPKAVVPTLVHHGIALRESTVINEYLEDRFPDPPLRPADPFAAASMRLLVKTVDDEIHGAIGILSYAIFLRHQMNERMSPAELEAHFRKVADPARRERQQSTHEKGLASPGAALAIGALQRLVAQMAVALDGSPWLAGEEFSLADAAALPYIVRARALRLAPLWEDQPGIGAWLDRGIAEVGRLPLADTFGSPSFDPMVASYAERERNSIAQLLDRLKNPGR